jgi:hypothetical protein
MHIKSKALTKERVYTNVIIPTEPLDDFIPKSGVLSPVGAGDCGVTWIAGSTPKASIDSIWLKRSSKADVLLFEPLTRSPSMQSFRLVRRNDACDRMIVSVKGCSMNMLSPVQAKH